MPTFFVQLLQLLTEFIGVAFQAAANDLVGATFQPRFLRSNGFVVCVFWIGIKDFGHAFLLVPRFEKRNAEAPVKEMKDLMTDRLKYD